MALGEVTPGLAEQWRRLARWPLQANPFLAPGNLLPAISVRGAESIELAVVTEQDRAMGLVAVRRLPGWRHLRRPVLTSRGLAGPVGLGRLGVPLLSGVRSRQALSALLGLLAQDGRAGLLVLEAFDVDGPVGQELHGVLRELRMPSYVVRRWTRPVANFPAGQPERGAAWGLDRHLRREVARYARVTGRQLGRTPVLVDRSGDEEQARRFVEIEAHTSKSGLPEGAGALTTVPGAAEWFVRSATLLGRQGEALLFSLEVDGRPLAMNYMLASPGRAWFGFKTWYSPQWRNCGLGDQLMAGILERARDLTPVRVVDSCTDEGNWHFGRYFTQSRQLCDVLIGLRGARDRVGVLTLPVARPLRRALMGLVGASSLGRAGPGGETPQPVETARPAPTAATPMTSQST